MGYCWGTSFTAFTTHQHQKMILLIHWMFFGYSHGNEMDTSNSFFFFLCCYLDRHVGHLALLTYLSPTNTKLKKFFSFAQDSSFSLVCFLTSFAPRG